MFAAIKGTSRSPTPRSRATRRPASAAGSTTTAASSIPTSRTRSSPAGRLGTSGPELYAGSRTVSRPLRYGIQPDREPRRIPRGPLRPAVPRTSRSRITCSAAATVAAPRNTEAPPVSRGDQAAQDEGRRDHGRAARFRRPLSSRGPTPIAGADGGDIGHLRGPSGAPARGMANVQSSGSPPAPPESDRRGRRSAGEREELVKKRGRRKSVKKKKKKERAASTAALGPHAPGSPDRLDSAGPHIPAVGVAVTAQLGAAFCRTCSASRMPVTELALPVAARPLLRRRFFEQGAPLYHGVPKRWTSLQRFHRWELEQFAATGWCLAG